MNQYVTLKWNKYGVTLVLDDQIDFETLLSAVELKFKDASKFFKDAKTAICFEGRTLNDDEAKQIIAKIEETADLEIICIVDNDKEREEYFRYAIENTLYEQEQKEQKESSVIGNGQFYKGTLRSGQILESDGDVIVLGDVNPGAKVVAARNVVILGSLTGTVYAGMSDGNAFVVAMSMNPMQIRIGDSIARSADTGKKKNSEPKIAFVEDGNIYIEPLNKEVIEDMKFLK